jgi:hypothetical protein
MCFVCCVTLAAINSNIGAAGYPTYRGFSHEFSIHIDWEAAILHGEYSSCIRELRSRVSRTTVKRNFQQQHSDNDDKLIY